MTRVIEIEDQQCIHCPLSVEFCGDTYCSVSKDMKKYSDRCIEGTDTEEFVKNHDLYLDLKAERDELESKLEQVPNE